MRIGTVGQANRWVVGVTLAVLLALLAPLVGCQHPAPAVSSSAATDSSPSAGAPSEAERTKAMEEKARELDRKAAEIQNMQGTEQEKIDAVNKLEQERQEMNKAADGAAPAPPPQ